MVDRVGGRWVGVHEAAVGVQEGLMVDGVGGRWVGVHEAAVGVVKQRLEYGKG